MNKDSDKNENRRDGDKNRSFGRRDDGRPGNGSANRPDYRKPTGGAPFRPTNSGPRNSDTDRPRFDRDDRSDGGGPRNDKPRFGRSDRSAGAGPRSTDTGDRPRSNVARPERRTDPDRKRTERSDATNRSPFGSRDRSDSDRSRFDRPSGPPRPSSGRNRNDSDRNRSGDSRTRFEQSDKPRVNPTNDRPRPADSDQRRPRFDNDRSAGRGDDKPQFERNDRTDSPNQRPSFNRPSEPRNDQFNGPDRTQTDRPRFERRDDSDRKRTGSAGAGDAPHPRLDGTRPFNRDDKGDRRSGEARPRNDRDGGPGPRFSRDSNDRSRPGKPVGPPSRPERVGGFSREADERNRENWSESQARSGRTSGPDKRDTPAADSRNTRFTPEQRKDSGERRTGFFVKAPNYELEQSRRTGNDQSRPVRDSKSGDAAARPRIDRYASKSRSGDRPNDKERDEKSTHTSTSEPGTTRLNRYIANSGVCSRREADELIAQGDISVNGKVVTEMGFRVKDGDMVKYGTKALTPERFVYVLLNKPKDYITTTEDPEERKTVMELVADAGNFRMYPVGRLDRKTTGLLLLTNDGELADKLTHPSNEVRKIYQVELDKPITEEHFDALKKGVDLEDGPIKPDALSIVTPDAYVVGIEIHSGRNHIVRRMFESLGYDVTKLDRTAYAGLTKKELPRGKWRFLDPKEVVKLKYLS